MMYYIFNFFSEIILFYLYNYYFCFTGLTVPCDRVQDGHHVESDRAQELPDGVQSDQGDGKQKGCVPSGGGWLTLRQQEVVLGRGLLSQASQSELLS